MIILNVYFRPSFPRKGTELKYWYEDTASGFVTVVATRGTDGTLKTLLTNGKFQGNDGGEVSAQIAVALLPCVAVAGRDRALVIGLGTGQSAETVASAGFAAVEVVEIAPGIVAAARAEFAELNRKVLDWPNVEFFLEDGRNHVLRSRASYDLISIELSSVWFAGVNNLYSKEFYELTRARLRPGGVLQQWIQLHHIAETEVLSVLATVRSVFPHASLWVIGGQGIILASDSPIAIRGDMVAALRALPSMARDLALLAGGANLAIDALETRVLLDAEDVTHLAEVVGGRGVPINTDANRFLEFATPRHNVELGMSAERLQDALLAYVRPEMREARRSRLGIPR